ncbi:ABC transporter permease subunit [Hydrogenophaga sp. 5NK40-0174]|uniref:ABC transporter permease n=1 Tax=Hydrogenophaga sp. 5NK40-0174 TaxID=3127649 RepID=UPI00333FEDF5
MSGYYESILYGAMWTVALSLAALVVSVLLGMLGAAAKLSGNPLIKGVATLYTTLIRGVPDLVLMLLVFYGGTIGLNNLLEWAGSKATVDINPFAAAVLTIGFIYGAYMTETFRGAIMAIPHGQVEAAWAFGMGRFRTFMRITIPQMVRYALPGFTNNWLVLIKTTSLASLIGLKEMTYLAKQASAATREPFTFFLFAAALFLIFTSISLWVLKRLERRYSLGAVRLGA